MREEKTTPPSEPQAENRPFADVQPLKERLYDQVKIPVKALDVIIALLVVATIALVVIGSLKGQGVL